MKFDPTYTSDSEESKSRNIGIAIMVFVAFVLLLSVVYVAMKDDPVKRGADFCPVDNGPLKVTVLLVDATEGVSKGTLEQLMRKISKVIHSMEEDEKLSLYLINDVSGDKVKPLFSQCKPKDGESTDPLTGSPIKVARLFRRNFDRPLYKALNNLEGLPKLHSSPIIEVLSDVTSMEFSDAQEGQLIVFSDLIQHSKHYSQIRSGIPLNKYSYSAPNFSRINVQVYYVWRSYPSAKKIQGEKHMLEWKKYFQGNGARNVIIKTGGRD